MTSGSAALPIEEIRRDFSTALDQGPVVITSPTGSGKSTQVPRWCRERGRVLVVEPRRVACRSLAVRVAELEGCRLGDAVGYSVRDEHRAGRSTEILFATTGVVLRMVARGGLDELDDRGFSTIILDELHERSLDVDLLLALFAGRGAGKRSGLVVMSATLDGERVASHLDGSWLRAEGRLFPVERHHVAGEALLPELRGLETRLGRALELSRSAPGDVLVFLPGKAEIASAAQTLAHRDELQVLPLHGGLSLDEQTRAFAPATGGRRKVVLATNVAETSITLPGIGVVVDSGLVRRTRYHYGRAYLTLAPIALDSAEQRSGRAGRMAPGECYRLWSEAALLENMTPPEVFREALAPLLLAAKACGADPEALPFLDMPKEYALDAARDELQALGALAEGGQLTDRGRQLFGLPVDPALARLLVEAESSGGLDDVIDLVATLDLGRRLFRSPARPDHDEEDDPRASGCDATARILALRGGRKRPWSGLVNGHVLAEALHVSRRLRRAFGLSGGSPKAGARVDRKQLARTALAADPRSAHVARSRRGRIKWSNGGTELELARESSVNAEKTQAVAVLESRAIGAQQRKKMQLLATCAIPLELHWLVDAGLGQDSVERTTLEKGKVVTKVQRVYARRILETREEEPTGELARIALRDLFVRGSIFRESLAPTTERLEARGLLARLRRTGLTDDLERWLLAEELDELCGEGLSPELDDWVLARLEELGVESGDDLALLSADDLLVPALPEKVREWLDRSFPRRLSFGDVAYRISYDLRANEVTLEKLQGRRQEPPPLSYLPPFPGFRIVLRDRSRVFELRK